MAWILTPSLVALRDAFNKRFTRRDKKSDGSIGNQAHAGTKSSHNPDLTGNSEVKDGDRLDEVRAIDVDADLGESGTTMLKVIQAMLADPATLKRLKYIIHNRTIWTANNKWRPQRYTGASPHTEHAHFNGIYTDDANGRPWPVVLNYGKGATVTSPLPDSKNVLALAWRMDALAAGLDTVRGGPMVGEPMWIVRQLKEILKTSQAAAGRADGVLLLQDVVTAWSTQNPEAVEPNVLRQALEQINGNITAVDPAVVQAAVAAVLTQPEFLGRLAATINADAAARLRE